MKRLCIFEKNSKLQKEKKIIKKKNSIRFIGKLINKTVNYLRRKASIRV